MADGISLQPMIERVSGAELLPWIGEVVELAGLLIASRGPVVSVGDFCEVTTATGKIIRMQVIGFRHGRVLSMPLEETDGLQLGDAVEARPDEARVEVGPGLLGRVIDGFGQPIDGRGGIDAHGAYGLYGVAGNPLQREHIT